MKKIKEWFYKIKANIALEKLSELERRSPFINKFFLGETKYSIEFDRWRQKLKIARKTFEKYKKYL